MTAADIKRHLDQCSIWVNTAFPGQDTSAFAIKMREAEHELALLSGDDEAAARTSPNVSKSPS